MADIKQDDIDLKCRICAINLKSPTDGLPVLKKELTEKILKYLYINVSLRLLAFCLCRHGSSSLTASRKRRYTGRAFKSMTVCGMMPQSCDNSGSGSLGRRLLPNMARVTNSSPCDRNRASWNSFSSQFNSIEMDFFLVFFCHFYSNIDFCFFLLTISAHSSSYVNRYIRVCVCVCGRVRECVCDRDMVCWAFCLYRCAYLTYTATLFASSQFIMYSDAYSLYLPLLESAHTHTDAFSFKPNAHLYL